MMNLKEFEVWFVAGSQHLYGEATLKQVAQHSQEMALQMTQSGKFFHMLAGLEMMEG